MALSYHARVTPSTALQQYTGDLLSSTREWTNLHDDELKRRAARAAMEKDVTELVSLTTAYLAHGGSSGVLTSPRTVEAYQLGTRQFVEYTAENAVSMLKPGRHMAQGYVNWMLAQGRKPAGVQLKVAAAGCLYRALRWAGATEADPFRDVRVPKDRTPGIIKRPPYSEDEMADVLDVADIHAKFLLFVTAHAGLRISEALALEWQDIDEDGGHIHVRSGKGRKARMVAMSTSLSRAARAYRVTHGPGGEEYDTGYRTTPPEKVFRYGTVMTARYHLQKAFRAAGVEFRGFHPGRKYAGTRLLQQVKDFGRVAAHLGHESVDTTRKGYARLAADDLKDDLAEW
ncbi:site-specific integrase [Deinococcus radiophilus]|uniref:Site-specific integrase n=1 Tax=Deinococcus radiophilus TaxID=32062 RepID=A0A431VQA4_9DEIO|nr:site-specific integrase [Deinococcus radiophilus]